MSLVIGHRVEGDGLVFIADTRVWCYMADHTDPPGHSCSKLVIPSCDLTLGFAGILPAVDDALRKVKEASTAQQVIEQIAEHTANGDFDCVAGCYAVPPHSSNDEQVVRESLRLLRIEKGSALEVPVAWVGDKSGFDLFQALWNGARRATIERNEYSLSKQMLFNGNRGPQTPSEYRSIHMSRLRAAMDEVIKSDEVPSVGDFQFSVISTSSGFQYTKYVDPFEEGPTYVAANTDILPKSAADGGFTTVRLDGNIFRFPSGPRYPAIYFPQGEFGYLYIPEDRSLPRAHRIPGSTVKEFVAMCREKYNVLLRGVGVTKEGYFLI